MKRWFVLLGAALCLYSQAEQSGVYAIRNATIHPASGPEIANGTVVVRNGLIESVGANAAVPPDAWVVEGKGLHVYPGLIDGLSRWGIPGTAPAAGDPGRRGGAPGPAAPSGAAEPTVQFLEDGGPEDRPSNTSWVKAADLVQAGDRSVAAARNTGFTTAVVFPTVGIFAGQGSALNLAGEKSGEMVVSSPVGLYLSTANRTGTFPGSLMGVIAYIRQIYLDADHYKQAKAMYAQNPRGLQRPAYDRALEGVLESPRILLPATRKVEAERMIRFGKELKTPFVLYGGTESWRFADSLAKAGVPLLVDLKWPERERDVDPELKESLRTLETRELAPTGPAALAKAGVKFAFYSGGVERPADLRRAVRKAIEGGLSKEEALKALTLYPAQIFGFDDRLGSLETGKIANLTITDGELFEDRSKVKFVLIDGKKYDQAPEAPAPDAAKPTRNGGN